MDDLIADFLAETLEGLAALDLALVRLEKAPGDAATISEIFRVIHTIKGTCGFLGLARLEAVAHAAENLLGRWRDGASKVTPDGITLVLQAVDRIRAIVVGLEGTGAEPPGDDTQLVAALDAAAADIGTTAPALPAAPEEAASTSVAEAMAEGGAAAPPQGIRVSLDVLENLMTLVSELVLTRNQLLQLSRARGDQAFAVPLQRLSHITSELQDGVMKTRMQPIGNAWAKLPRLVRDLARELGKKIELEMQGADTELDRQVLELIRDPLTHMVRNSADHGLESTEARRRAGKPETGRITLDAYHEGGHILIGIADDGKGLDTARIREKVLAQGLASEAELAGMSDREIHRFIFRAGFSTANAVTAVSGRGVGMDVVKTNVERIGGTIDVASVAGGGTGFTIKIPLTLAIVSALVVEVSGERFAIPQIGVLELVRVGGASGARVERIGEAPVLRLRDRLLPLVGLARVLGLDGCGSAEQAGFVVVTQVGPATFGIIVDRVHDTEEIVVKPVPPILRHIGVFSGNTILGDGSVIMILDTNGIARAAGVSAEGEAKAAAEAAWPGSMRSAGKTALLLFRAGDATPKAVPLGLVARLDDLPVDQVEQAGGQPVVQYRGQLMPLVPMGGSGLSPEAAERGRQTVLVFSERERSFGLMVDAILDVVEEHLELRPGQDHPGFLGTAVIAGRVTEVMDTAWWLRQAGGDWFRPAASAAEPRRLLVVEDSGFFRDLVVPALAAIGYDVTAVAAAAEALALRERGAMFDAIVSDIEMPGMDGFALARTLKEGGAWAGLPLIALSGRSDPGILAAVHAAGFSDYVPKFDRAALAESLRRCLAPAAAG